MNTKIAFACALGLAAAAGNAWSCYTVYGAGNRVVYQARQAPVDMSIPLADALARRFPGQDTHMVFAEGECRAPASAQRSQRAQRVAVGGRGSAPLLTDRATAEELDVPHTVVAGDIVMVPPAAAARVNLPAVTVIPAVPETAVAQADAIPDTRTLGGPARARPQTVITELRDPPVTIVERR